MTVSTQVSSATRSWTGGETVFATGIFAYSADDIQVTYRGGTGTATVLTRSQAAVALDARGFAIVTPVAMPPAPGTLTIKRFTAALQTTPFLDLSDFSAAVHEKLHDLAAMRDAELRRDVDAVDTEVATNAAATAQNAATTATSAAATATGAAATVVAGVRKAQRFSVADGTLTVGQTVLTVSGGYDVGKIDVLRNGVDLVFGVGFTATNGATVTVPAALSTDVYVIKCYGVFVSANSLDKAQNLADVLNASVARTNIGAAQNLGSSFLRNRLKNGSFAVNQRGYVSGTATAAGVYMHDRWKATTANTRYSFTQIPVDTTITIAAGTLAQIVENTDVEGGVYILSWTGTATARVAINGAVPSGAFAASPIITGNAAAGYTITVEFSTGTVGKVQLEPGVVSSPFEREAYSAILEKCQRYYETGSFVLRQYSVAGQDLSQSISFKATKRAVPTIGYGNNSAINLSVYDVRNADAGQALIYGLALTSGLCLFDGFFSADSEL